MSRKGEIGSSVELRAFYGTFFPSGAGLVLEKRNVPKPLHALLHYAAFWGVTDDRKRERLIDAAPKAVIANLVAVVDKFDDELDDWLAGPEADSATPTLEYLAFSAMRMAADLAAD